MNPSAIAQGNHGRSISGHIVKNWGNKNRHNLGESRRYRSTGAGVQDHRYPGHHFIILQSEYHVQTPVLNATSHIPSMPSQSPVQNISASHKYTHIPTPSKTPSASLPFAPAPPSQSTWPSSASPLPPDSAAASHKTDNNALPRRLAPPWPRAVYTLAEPISGCTKAGSGTALFLGLRPGRSLDMGSRDSMGKLARIRTPGWRESVSVMVGRPVVCKPVQSRRPRA